MIYSVSNQKYCIFAAIYSELWTKKKFPKKKSPEVVGAKILVVSPSKVRGW